MILPDYYSFINQRFQEFSQFQLHELSNKFNLLSLSLEDLRDVLEEDPTDESWKEEIVQVGKMKTKFLDFLNEAKLTCRFNNGPQVTLEEALVHINKIKVKGLNKKSIQLNGSDLDSKDESVYLKTPLLHFLWNFISLRLYLLEECKIEFSSTFLRQNNDFLEKEKAFLETHGVEENFQKYYLGEMKSFQNLIAKV